MAALVTLAGTAIAAWTAGCGPAQAPDNNSGVDGGAPTPTPNPNPNPNPNPDPQPNPVAPGFVTSPINGQLFTGTTTLTVIDISGTYTGTAQEVTVQIMDPSNNNQWTSVGAASVQAGSFNTTIGPFNALQWPQGGLLAMQVIDDSGAALPYQLNNDQGASNTALIVGSPGQNPTDWTFLTQQPIGNSQETALYYQTIGAPQTLNDFQNEFFPDGVAAGGAANALFYNKADLGVARDLSCNTTQTGGVACFVKNFGTFDGNENTALNQLEDPGGHRPTSTFAMIYNPPITAPNAIQFVVYDGNGDLDDSTQIDQFGNNTSVPQACLNCHGAQSSFNAGTAQVTGRSSSSSTRSRWTSTRTGRA